AEDAAGAVRMAAAPAAAGEHSARKPDGAPRRAERGADRQQQVPAVDAGAEHAAELFVAQEQIRHLADEARARRLRKQTERVVAGKNGTLERERQIGKVRGRHRSVDDLGDERRIGALRYPAENAPIEGGALKLSAARLRLNRVEEGGRERL